MGQPSDSVKVSNLSTLNFKDYESRLMVSSPARLRGEMERDEYRQFMSRVNLRPIRSLNDDLQEAIQTNDVDYLDAVLRSLAYPVWHQAITLTHPSLPDAYEEDTRVLQNLAAAIDRAARLGLGCILESTQLWRIDAAVRYIAEQRESLFESARRAGHARWIEHLQTMRPYDFLPVGTEGTAWRLAALEHRMVQDSRHGMDRVVGSQQYREELEGIARHIPGHRTDSPGVIRNQRYLAELALALGYQFIGRAIGMAVPSELTTVAPDFIVTSEATGETIHGDPVVNLYLSDAASDRPRGLTEQELSQWGKLIARNVPYSSMPRQAATVLNQRFGIQRFGLAACGSVFVIAYTIDDRGFPDEGKPLIHSDSPESLFGKTVDQLLEQSNHHNHAPRSESEVKLLAESLVALADLARSPAEKSHRAPDYEAEVGRLLRECDIEFAAVPAGDGGTFRLRLHPHELHYSPLTLIRCSLVNQIAAQGNPASSRWAGIVWQHTQRWNALKAA